MAGQVNNCAKKIWHKYAGPIVSLYSLFAILWIKEKRVIWNVQQLYLSTSCKTWGPKEPEETKYLWELKTYIFDFSIYTEPQALDFDSKFKMERELACMGEISFLGWTFQFQSNVLIFYFLKTERQDTFFCVSAVWQDSIVISRILSKWKAHSLTWWSIHWAGWPRKLWFLKTCLLSSEPRHHLWDQMFQPPF